ncbi:hypothetical protein [Microbacterium sp. 1.5R]|uniref:hypothetical protein n=1 Tax=Microbacterium sp. 1.5R TaxID=1916917 RepID=UPI0016424160|nr:hypothetical protein [Microbacterium sp. 1.5R]
MPRSRPDTDTAAVDCDRGPRERVLMFEFPPFDDPWWQTADAHLLWDLYGPGA